MSATLITDVIESGKLAFGGPNEKPLRVARYAVTLDGTSGASAGDIPASLFGMTKLLFCSGVIITGAEKAYSAVISEDGGSIQIVGPIVTGTGSTIDAPAGTYNTSIIGY